MDCSTARCEGEAFCKGICRRCYNAAHYAANREKAKARSRAWYEGNPERAAAARAGRDKAVMRAHARAWYARNKLRAIAAQSNARARRYGVPGILTVDGLRARLDYFAGICWVCKTPGANTIDHVLALGAGGPNHHSNIRPAHLGCNAARSWEGRR